ncbi:MAG TPA: T9SS type A sorting domain-containing protein [Bacteroidia bacterium]|jgi:hypothetical protein|nr:T9SS type A sorting domain-containing protein [Bacteroidia bacterium]HQF29229.1 T9SS type A sorting domain-containing protein [Bacteroidia bacterium]HQK96390.1 T9SS type A sorting domain-containing protein [Bacteroidia bacterium]
MKLRTTGIVIIAAVILILKLPLTGNTKKAFHSPEDIQFFTNHKITPLDSGQYFHLPQQCKGCHGFDSLHLANVDINGHDINLYDDWETSMMGMSGIDPLWKAKVSHEIQVNPGHANELQTLCTSCHAPLGHYTAFYKGQPFYTLADLANDSLGQSGVSCHSCHAIKDSTSLGYSFTGEIPYDTNRNIYGPFPGPMPGPMQLYVSLTPNYGPHMSDSKTCSPCHTLISHSVDLTGTPTGSTFVEQAVYQEYLNSEYPTSLQTTCQNCHMPKIEDPIKIANGYTALPGRTPFNLHSFAGANAFMVNLIKNNKTSLGSSAPDANFDSTLVAINNLLKTQTLAVNANFDSTASDTAYFNVSLLNKAGHKFPSAYPSRRAVLQFVAIKANGDTLFSSGLFDSNFEVKNIPSPYSPHFNTINQESQSQIYEMVMGDVNGNVTTVLERAFSQLKDNRIPPFGFTTTHASYDTVKIVGDALTDPDFNKTLTIEGSGRDIVHYNIPLNGYTGALTISAAVYYQAVPPGWLSEMRNYSSAEIDTFLNMYDNADRSPILVSNDTLNNVLITTGIASPKNNSGISISPNPTNDGIVYIKNISRGVNITVNIYNAAGQIVNAEVLLRNENAKVILPNKEGIYFISINEGKKRTTKKIVYLK